MEFPFLFDSMRGGAPNLNNRSESASRKIRAVLEAMSHTTRKESFGVKKCHFFRRFCNSLLIDMGVSSEYRNNLAGWKGGIADNHYTDKKRQAVANPGPHKLAGKQDANDTSHPLFDMIANVQPDMIHFLLGEHPEKNNQVIQYFAKIAIVYMACGYAPQPFTTMIQTKLAELPGYHNFSSKLSHFGTTSLEYIRMKGKMEQAAPISDKKRIRDLTDQLSQERVKCAKLELEITRLQQLLPTPVSAVHTDVNYHQSITTAVRNLLLLRGETTFPQKCLHVVQETILPLIRKHNQQFNKDGFVIKFQEPDGKQLKRILVFAALLQFGQNIIDITKPQSNWLSYAEKLPQAAGIHTKTFSEYQQHHFK
jgi:hypothetical protein